MKPFLRLSLAEQTAAHLRAKLLAGHWGGKLPGVLRLCAELNVAQSTMRAAIRQLEAEGALAPGGPGRSRTVAAGVRTRGRRRALRVGVLLHEQLADEKPGMQGSLALLQHEIEQAVEMSTHPCHRSFVHIRNCPLEGRTSGRRPPAC